MRGVRSSFPLAAKEQPMLKLVCPHCGGTSFKVLSRAVDRIPMECLSCHRKLTIDVPGGLAEPVPPSNSSSDK